jgi:imidazolonepropionase-like amidohydrolase
MKRLIWVLFFTTTALAAAGRPAEVTVLTNVNVVDVLGGKVERNMTVVLKEGRIESIARVGLIGRGRGIHVINASGKFLVPGFWDMHVHSAGGSGPAWDEKIIYPLYVVQGITGVRDMGGDLDLLQARQKKVEAGELLAPTLVISGPFITGGKSGPQVLGVRNVEEARQAVDDLKGKGVDFIKLLDSVPREAYFAMAEECRKQKIAFAGHVPDAVSAAEASAAGQHSMEHLMGISLACSSKEAELRRKRVEAFAQRDAKAYQAAGEEAMQSYDPAKARLLFKQFASNSTWQVPTLVWWKAQSRFDDKNLAQDDRLKYVPAWARRQWNPQELAKDNPPEAVAALRRTLTRYIELVRMMHKENVQLLAGTDSPDPYDFPGFSLHEEFALLAEAGLSAPEILRIATYYPAVFLGRSDKAGTIDKGKVADLVLLTANPLQEAGNLRKISAVVLHGRYLDREQLDKMLAEVEALAERAQ